MHTTITDMETNQVSESAAFRQLTDLMVQAGRDHANGSTVLQSGKTYVLVHGAWHGAWCWNKLTPLMQVRGHKAIAVDLPGHGNDSANVEDISLDDYVNKVAKCISSQDESVILVGHSMSGIVISQVAEKLGGKKISALVYLDAFLPRDGETLFSLVEATLRQLPANSLSEPSLVENIILSEDHKTNTINPGLAGWLFYHDCPEEETQFALARMSKEPVAPLATPLRLTDEVYGAIPKYYILCRESKDLDKTFLSTNMPCKKIYRLPSGHSPFFSMPEKLEEILNEIG
ncbi:MAG TPA: alpha/beta fold hydrolase [Flavisolibacter sp.]|nr:alpha/beta fold hydrolase [Flavisolibacter sp.]